MTSVLRIMFRLKGAGILMMEESSCVIICLHLLLAYCVNVPRREASQEIKRGFTREWTMLVPSPTQIWLKIAISAGNDLKPNLKVEFWTFISKNIEKIAKILIFWKNMKNALPNLPNPRMVLEKNGKTNFGSYGPKDFAEKGIFGISQGTRLLGPLIG